MPKHQYIRISVEVLVPLRPESDVSDDRVQYAIDQVRQSIESTALFVPRARGGPSDQARPHVQSAESIGTRGDGMTFRNTYRREA